MGAHGVIDADAVLFSLQSGQAACSAAAFQKVPLPKVSGRFQQILRLGQ